MDHSHSIDIEAPAVPLEDRAPSNEEIASGEIEAASLADGHPSAEESIQEYSLAHFMRKKYSAFSMINSTIGGPTIFRVPAHLRENKENLIEPSVVSIGPYHRGKRHLKPMEDKKWLLLKYIMSKPNMLEACVEKVKCLQLRARNCYSERVDMDDDSFVEMLILDGTFIIRFICQSLDWFNKEIGWASISIKTDLILLENQIPFFVVQSLWDLCYPDKPLKAKKLKSIGGILCSNLTSGNINIPPNKVLHLLHLCHHIAVPDMSKHQAILPPCSCFNLCTVFNCNSSLPSMSSKLKNSEDFVKFPCVTDLEEAGIKFRIKKSPCNMMDVTFQGGMLEIPSTMMSGNFKNIFINLLAFEQCQAFSVPRHFTTYATFMDGLINTEHDVATLKKHGIIGNLLSDKDVVLFFSHLCDGVVLVEDHYLCILFEQVNRYCCSKRQRFKARLMQYRAKLMRDYFNSPWSLISFIAAVIILGLTFAQTYFAGYDHFNPSPK